MVSRKRAYSEVEATPVEQDREPSLLKRLRNCWELANLMQYIFTFGKIMKIDEDLSIEDLETECLKLEPSEKLLDIGLSLLKFVSSHRGLTYRPQNFNEYTRRQYNAKAPHLPNPFGYDDEPKKFNEFDVFLKLRILHQLSVWTFWNPDRIREKMPEQREIDQTQWRVEELGYDGDDRLYYILDDNRLYRRTDPPIPPLRPAKPKANTKKARAAAKAAKRRKFASVAEEDDEEKKADIADSNAVQDSPGGLKWECIAVTLPEYQRFIEALQKTKDPNEQILRDRLIEEVLPVIEKLEEAQLRKRAKQEKELLNMQLLAGAKRSSRIAGKQERERQEREAAEASRKQEAELTAARKEQEKQKKMEDERHHRMATREQRIRDREQRRLLHEAELARMAEEQKKLENGESRVSERHLRVEIEKRKRSLEKLVEEDQWTFDCSGCGVHGENIDDGSHSVACERCSVWQHSKCLGILQTEAERDDFHFVCNDCKRREEEAKRPKIPPLKFRIGPSSSPPSPTAKTTVVNKETHIGVDAQSPFMGEVQHHSAPTYDGLDHPHTGFQGSTPVPSPENGSPHTAQQLVPQINGIFSPTTLFRRSQLLLNGHSNSRINPSKVSNPPPFKAPHKAKSSPKAARLKFIPSPYSSQSASRDRHPDPEPPASLGAGPLDPKRPSSSNSTQSQILPSPIQNRPSMSPTQGNPDVGPLAGFPSSTLPNGSAPHTPLAHRQFPRPYSSSIPPLASSFDRRTSFSSGIASAGNSFTNSSPGHGSQAVPLSGLSPTKNSPRAIASGIIGGASILPPVQRLHPSPKLMGRSSPDAPIPAPVKAMAPKQQEYQQREDEMIAQMEAHSGLHTPPLRPVPGSLTSSDFPVLTQPAKCGQEAVHNSQNLNGH